MYRFLQLFKKIILIVADLCLETKSDFKCPLCDFTAKKSQYIARHKRTVHGEKKYQCEFCAFVTADPVNIKRHRNTKHFNVKYKCDECDYEASQQRLVKIHKDTKHLGIRDDGIGFKRLTHKEFLSIANRFYREEFTYYTENQILM